MISSIQEAAPQRLQVLEDPDGPRLMVVTRCGRCVAICSSRPR